ncbi:MAG: hypothetical protein ABI859_05065 [Pseudomonadota bacterium]
MANRRQFLQAGLALSAASVVLVAPLASTGTTRAPFTHLTHFVFDNRFPEAVAIARSMQGRAPLAEINGDMTHLWFNQLHAQWKRAPEALGGVTTAQGLFVLQTLAADHRMRVVYRRELAARDATLVSWIIAPRARALART